MLKEAVRREILETDVTKQVETLKATTTERGTFPQDVVNRLFDQKTTTLNCHSTFVKK
jgi:hypothetical protein